jgi:hypothetical protein
MHQANLERREAIEFRVAEKNRLIGHAAVFDKPSRDLGGFIEYVRRGAFKRSLASGADVIASIGHDSAQVLGRRGAGTLALHEDERGLRFEIDMPPTQIARDLLISIERGDVAGASFAFRTAPNGDKWDFKSKPAVRELLDVDLLDVTITGLPAYPDTTVALRTLRAEHMPHIGVTNARRYLETL